MPTTFDFTGRVALVTAATGIGEARRLTGATFVVHGGQILL
jgi:hypothetical protein